MAQTHSRVEGLAGRVRGGGLAGGREVPKMSEEAEVSRIPSFHSGQTLATTRNWTLNL